MQGLWKEKLSGWNHKDSKRKSQKRRHSFKDKARGIASRHGSNWKQTKQESRLHSYSQYEFDTDGYWLLGVYGVNFKCHRDWVTAYPENQGRRKRAQKLANRITRAKMKAWINKGDWDTVPKSHSLEKSIAWEIH